MRILSAVLITISFVVISCNTESSNKASITVLNCKKQLQSDLDSATRLYKYAITDMENGFNKDSVISKYQPLITNVHKKINSGLDSLYKLHTAGEIDSLEFETLIKSLNSDSVTFYSNGLKNKGIEFALEH